MARKFTRDMIPGNNSKKDNSVEKKESFRIGDGLLSEESKSIIKLNVINVPRNEIDKNTKNKYSIDKIEELVWSIKQLGLIQPLHVTKKEDGRYLLLGGERRLTAIDRLIADPDVADWNEYTLIPVVVKAMDDISLPLSNDLKERLAIISTNKEARTYTDADRMHEILEWRTIIQELRKAGVTSIPSVDEEGNEAEIQIKGEKTRDIIAKTTGMSAGSVNAFAKVENQGSDELFNSLMENQITVKTANSLIDLTETKEEQDEILEKLKQEEKELTPGNIKNAVKGLVNEKTNEKNTHVVSEELFLAEVEEIMSYLKDNEVVLTDAAFKKYGKHLNLIKNIIFNK